LRLFDSHCHLDAPEFEPDRAQVLARARAAGVTRQLVPAVDRAGWSDLRDLSAAEAGLYPAYGLHPMYLDRHRDDDLPALSEWIERERPPAIGECGLDFFVEGLDPERQRHFCRGQLEIALEFGLPVVLHARRSLEELIAMLRAIGGLRGVVHSYSGSMEQATQLFRMGFLLGIGGPVTYERAHRLRRIVAAMPLEFLLLETDAPDQPDAGRRGQRNEPGFLATVCEQVAKLRGTSMEAVAEATANNAARLLGLSSS
jgi:TatD DNase family protein